jgi:hypothetical protein
MSVSRIALRIKAANASVAAGDTGQLYGCIQQMRWVPTVGDTGADLNVTLCHTAAGDTANALTILDRTDCMGSAFTRNPVQPLCASDGFDTGVDAYTVFVGADDRVRAKCQPAGNAAVDGTLYIWTYSG